MSNNIIIANAGAVVNVINNENALIKQKSRDKWQENECECAVNILWRKNVKYAVIYI